LTAQLEANIVILYLKDQLAASLAGTRAYSPIRSAYQHVFNRSHIRIRAARRAFYAQFIRPGFLVFDVGANVGDYTEDFLSLGATVVAFEPNPRCQSRLRGLSRRCLTVRSEAVGDSSGESFLHTGTQTSLSTLSTEWMSKASVVASGYSWNDIVRVGIIRLDEAVRDHGVPNFIKIDVEGSELNVLRGLTSKPGALSFEFHTFTSTEVDKCLRLPLFAGSKLNISLSNSWEMVWPEWRGAADVLGYISQLQQKQFGDIYAKFG
jgi:FkbM family methyltransferase